MKKKYKLFSLIIMSIIISCTIKYIPVPSKMVSVTDNHAVIKMKNYIIITENKYWVKEPQNLTDYFTTFYITIINRTEDKIKIIPQDFSLLDENGNQFDIIDNEQIEKLLLPQEIKFEPIINVTDKQQQLLENWINARKNLMSESFHFGSILPKARKSGFIFFTRLPSDNKKCDLIFKDNKINFIRGD